ncbi:MAG TPA: glycosyltransferase 87 family protein, partial [Candidatus Binatia bacterium]
MSTEQGRLSSMRSLWSRHRAKALGLAIIVMGVMAAQRTATGFSTVSVGGIRGDVADIFHDLVPRWFGGQPVYAYSYLAVHPPATYAILWPVFGTLDIDAARAVWIALLMGGLAWLMYLSVVETRASSAQERVFAALMPPCMYATLLTVVSGQFGVVILPLLVCALILLKRDPPSWRRDILSGALLLLALVKPTVAAPFVWIALFLPGGIRPVMLASFAYAALTIIALTFQPTDAAALFREWQERSYALASTAGSANLHRMLARFASERWLLPVSFAAFAALGWWTHRSRAADVWLLLGVAAVFARFWTYHRHYDDILILLPAIALFRLAKRAASDDGV